MVSRVGLICLAVLLVLAGCTGGLSSESGVEETTNTSTVATVSTATTPSTPTASDTTTATSTTTTATLTTTTASTTATPPAHATLYDTDLAQSDRELLRRAVENGSVRVTRSNLTGQLTPDKDGWYTRFDGTLYELSWRYDGLYGKYQLQNVTSVSSSTVETSDDVVAYQNLTSDARNLFDVVRSGNESEMHDPDAFPEQLRNKDYVNYDGDYYALELVVGDYIVYRLSVTEVES